VHGKSGETQCRELYRRVKHAKRTVVSCSLKAFDKWQAFFKVRVAAKAAARARYVRPPGARASFGAIPLLPRASSALSVSERSTSPVRRQNESSAVVASSARRAAEFLQRHPISLTRPLSATPIARRSSVTEPGELWKQLRGQRTGDSRSEGQRGSSSRL